MIRVRTTFTGRPGSPGYSNLYFGGDTAGEAQAAVTEVLDFWDGVSAYMTSGTTIVVGGDVDLVDPATGQTTGVFSVGDESTASSGAGAEAPALQGLVRWRTGDYVNGREIRGRLFVPWLSSEAYNSGVPSAAFLTQLFASADNLRVDASTAGGLMVYSQTHGQASLVTSVSTWNQFAVMRSRRD